MPDGLITYEEAVGAAPLPVPSSTAPNVSDGDSRELTVHLRPQSPSAKADAPPAPVAASTSDAPKPGVTFGSAPASPAVPAGFISYEDATAPETPHAGGILSNAPDDTMTSAAAKAIPTTVIKGLSHIPGIFGDAMDLGDYLLARAQAKIQGRPADDVLREYSINREASKNSPTWFLDPRNFLPSGSDISDAILSRTGEYQPTSEPGRLAMAGGEAALGMLNPGGGAKALLPNAAVGAIGQAATDATGDPLYGMAAAPVVLHGAQAAAAAAKKVAVPAVMGIPGIDNVPVIGPAVSAARDQAAGGAILKQSSDPAALRDWAQQPPALSPVPGSPQTLAGAVGNDPGLFQAEKDARNVDNERFNQIDRDQSAAQQAAIQNAQPTGDVFRPGQIIRQRLDAVDQAAQAAEDRLNAAHQEAVGQRTAAAQDFADQQRAALAERTIARGQASGDEKTAAQAAADAAHQRLVSAFQDAHGQVAQAASDAAAPLASVPSPEQVGAVLRAAQDEATNAAKEARNALYRAVDPDGVLTTVVTPLKAAQQDLARSIDPYAGTRPTGAEASLWSDIARMPDVIPFQSLQKLDTRVTAAMKAARLALQRGEESADTEAPGRLTRLKGAVADAIQNAADNQAAHEAQLVRQGLLSPEETINARFRNWISGHFERQRTSRLAANSARAGGSAGRSAPADAGLRGAGGAEPEGLGSPGGVPGVQAPSRPVTGSFAPAPPTFADRSVSARLSGPDIARDLGIDIPGTKVRAFAGPLSSAAGEPQGIVAFHGTPHEFDRFDLSKIGTGEGNQAYGHGLYVAENKDVAQVYRDNLSKRDADFRLGSQGYRRSDVSPDYQGAYDHVVETGSLDAAFKEAQQAASKAAARGDYEDATHWTQRAQTLEKMAAQGFSLGGEGNVYTVQIQRKPEEFVDWGAPFSKQSPYVQERLKQLDELRTQNPAPAWPLSQSSQTVLNALKQDPKFSGKWDLDEDRAWYHARQLLPDWHERSLAGVINEIRPYAESGYQGPSLRFDENPESVGTLLSRKEMLGPDFALAMRKKGIAGIRYLDGSSRGAGEGTSNYVVFNDKDLRITQKNGREVGSKLTLPDYLRGEAAGSFSKELLRAAGAGPFSKDLSRRAAETLGGGTVLDHGRAYETAFGDRYEALRQSLSGEGRGAAQAGGSSPGAAEGVPGDGLGRGQPRQAGGAPLAPNWDEAAGQRLADAKAAHADYAQTFKNPTVRPVLDTTGFAGQFKIPAGAIPSRAIVSGQKGYETAQAFIRATGAAPEAVTALQNAALLPLKKAVPPAGNLHPNALARWKENYSGALKALDEASPGFSSRFDNAATATQAVLDLAVQQKQAIAAAQRESARQAVLDNLARREALGQANAADRAQVGALLSERAADDRSANAQSRDELGARLSIIRDAVKEAHSSPGAKFIGNGGDRIASTEVENAVGSMLKTGRDGATRMQSLVASVAHDPEAVAGLRKAGVDWMVRNFQNADGTLSGAKFIDFIRDNRDTLRELYPTSQVSMFGAVARDAEQNARWRTQTAIKGGSDTVRNLGPMFAKAGEAAKHTSMAVVAIEAMREGAERHGFLGAAGAGAAAAGAYLVGSLRSAGIRSVADLYREALADPEKARLLISKMPSTPEGGKLRALTGLLRRELIVGNQKATGQ